MTAREFCYWLQGMFELNGAPSLDERQTRMIKNHLDMVFIHDIDPSYPEGDKLSQAHNKPGGSPPVMRC
jgi:hypothetical protein